MDLNEMVYAKYALHGETRCLVGQPGSTVEDFRKLVASSSVGGDPESVELVAKTDYQAMVNPGRTLAEALDEAYETIAARRDQAIERGQVSFKGYLHATGAHSQQNITAAVIKTDINPDLVYDNWKCRDQDGNRAWIRMDGADLKQLAELVGEYDSRCRDIEQPKAGDLGTRSTVESVQEWLANQLEEGWPA